MTDIRQKLIDFLQSTYWGAIDGGADYEDYADEIVGLIAEGAEQRLADGPFKGSCQNSIYTDPDGNEYPLEEMTSAVLGRYLQISDVANQFEVYYRRNPEWGFFHVILDDGNADDYWVERYQSEVEEKQATTEERHLLVLLLRMSEQQRLYLARSISEKVDLGIKPNWEYIS